MGKIFANYAAARSLRMRPRAAGQAISNAG
jgi:hypothetical protein